MADRYDALTPKDLVITFRSLPRRFGEVTTTVGSDPELFARVDEPGPDGRSLSSIVNHAAERLDALAAEIEHLLSRADPTVSGRALKGDDLTAVGREPPAIEQARASLERRARAVADLLDRQDADTWARQARIDSGGEIDLVTLVRATIREVVEDLRAAEQQLALLH